MADRYQDRAYGAGQGRGGEQYGSDRGEGDPLAELARLIGQTDPFGKSGGPAQQRPAPPRQEPRQPDIRQQDLRQPDLREPDLRQPDPRQQDLRQPDLRQQDLRQDYYSEEDYAQSAPEPEQPPAPPGPPAWIQRANIRREAPRDAAREFQRELPRETPRALSPEPEPDDYLNAVHPLHRYAPQPHTPLPQPDPYFDQQPAYQQQVYQQDAYQDDPQAYAESEQQLDPSRYDDALYGQLDTGAQDFQREAAYPDDPYAYQGEYDEELEEPQKRRGLPFKVGAVLALGVFGVAAAYGYHSYFGTTRSGEIPIIKADNSPTKIVPQQTDASTKLPDRLVTGDGAEKIVPREEQPVDINTRNVGPRVVFPNLNQNANPPQVASVAPTGMPPAPSPAAGLGQPSNSGTLLTSEPHKIKTLSLKSDQPDPSAVPASPPPATTPPPVAAARNPKIARGSPTQANASANAPMSLSPQGQPIEPGPQIAATNPAQVAPSAPAASGGYLVSITSQPSEADSQAAFRVMQDKYPSVLGSQPPVIARATTKTGATTYRAGVSFPTHEEAAKFCKSYESAGGQCWVVKN